MIINCICNKLTLFYNKAYSFTESHAKIARFYEKFVFVFQNVFRVYTEIY